ncbi:MAG TPA: hypothetical protein ENG81_01100 [Candidatus Bathyarchaeota archaeon]|nr:hypothetical protein [Candidatus Bathyarchaeota archaeon]
MADVKEIIIDRWDGGMKEQVRNLPNGYFKYLENLSVGKDGSTIGHNFVATKDDGGYGGTPDYRSLRRILEVNGLFLALGNDGGTDTSIWQKDGAAWTSQTITANYAIDHRDNPFFVYDAGYILFHNNEKIGLYKVSDKSNNGDFLSLAGGLWGGVMWQGNAYGWNGQKVYKIDVGDYAGSQSITEMVEIPSDQEIVELLPYGNDLMAIICTSTTNESLMYIWDGVTTTTFYDIINIGRGTVSGGAVLEGIITVIMESSSELLIKQYDQVVLKTVHTLDVSADVSGDTEMALYRTRAYNGFIYILGIVTRPDGAGSTGEPVMYRYGRKDITKPMSFCVYKYFDYIQTDPNNVMVDLLMHESVVSGVDSVPSYFALVTEDDAGDDDATVEEIQTSAGKTVNVQVGIIETGIYTLDASILKALSKVNIQLSALPAAGKVIVKYKKDADATWTTIATNAVDDTISHVSVNIESTGVNLPEFREIAFRIELSGGAEMTAFKAKYEEKDGNR